MIAPVHNLKASPSAWIDAEEAAQRMGKSVRQVRRICADELAEQGLARKLVPIDGGKGRWFVDRRYHPCLLDGPTGDIHTVRDLSAFTAKQRQTAIARLNCLMRFREARRNGGVGWERRVIDALKSQCPQIGISRTSLRRWDSIYRGAADIVHLIDRRGGNRYAQADEEAWACFASLYLKESQPKARDCWRITRETAKAENWQWCSYDSLMHQLAKRIPPQTQAFHRDPKRYRMQFEPFLQQDPERYGAGECWVGDHSQADFFCWIDGELKRPWLSIWLDWRTRRIAGWVLSESACAMTIRQALKNGILDEVNSGPPSVAWIDNGKDYDSWELHGETKQQRRKRMLSKGHIDERQFKGVFGLLGIEPHFSIPYGPNGKARCERFFGTWHAQFDKHIASYCGAKAGEKPEGLNNLIKDHPERIPTFEQVKTDLALWIAQYNSNCEHGIDDLVQDGKRLSPDEAMMQRSTKRVLAEPRVVDYLAYRWTEGRVNRNGITIKVNGVRLSYGQFSEYLRPFKGLKKDERQTFYVCYDDANINEIFVFDSQCRYISTEPMNNVGGRSDAIGVEAVKDHAKNKAQYNRAMRTIRENRHIEYMKPNELVASAAQKRKAKKAKGAAAIRVIQSPIDAQAKEIERDKMRRMAAGAESIEFADEILDLSDMLPPRQVVDYDEEMPVLDIEPSFTFKRNSGDDWASTGSLLDRLHETQGGKE